MPAIGWNIEDNVAAVIRYGVADYEPRKSTVKIVAPFTGRRSYGAPTPVGGRGSGFPGGPGPTDADVI